MSGFKVLSVDPVEELGMSAIRLLHEHSGARLLHLKTDDDENLFSVTFLTPPTDDTGVAHIVEHCVLSGSRKFPVRDPFFEMVKMSVATFINAMTGHDCTCYPVSSNVKQDLFNLADVYFDSVFHPKLSRETFMREAYHYCPADAGKPLGDLAIKGVVFSEMKGVYSNPEWKIQNSIARHMFPESTYGRDYGGMPEKIPGLSYEAFKDFYKRHYTPENAFFVVYGNIPTDEYAQFLGKRLDPIKKAANELPRIVRQPRWTEPRVVTDIYPIGRADKIEAKTYITINWMAGDTTDPDDAVALHILGLILCGNEAAPLRKAIVESQLGQDTFLLGESAIGVEAIFSAGIKGSEPDRTDAFTRLALDVLEESAKNIFTPSAVDAAFQQAAYHQLEIHSGFPLHMLGRAIAAWPYGGDPLAFLRMKERLAKCRRRYEGNNAFFNQLIRERILENPHRLTLVLKPDVELQERLDSEEIKRLSATRDAMSPSGCKRIAKLATELEISSTRPNPAAAVARLPQLKIGDLPEKPRHIPSTAIRLETGNVMLINHVLSNGVNYLLADFDLTGLPEKLWPCIPFYCDAVQKLGVEGMNYQDVAREISLCTGGIACWPYLLTRVSPGRLPVRRLRFSMKTLDDKIGPALDILSRIIFTTDPLDRNRMRDIAVQSLAEWRTRIVHSGATTAALRAARGLSENAYVANRMGGIPQLEFSRDISDRFDAHYIPLVADMEAIRNFLLARGRMCASFTGSDRCAEITKRALTEWSMRMRGERISPAPAGFRKLRCAPSEGLATPIQVAHCALAAPAPHVSGNNSVHIALGAHIVSMDFMLPEIRFKGNAYGAWCRYDSMGEMLSLGSYSDPHIVETLNVFAAVEKFVKQAAWTRTDINRAIIALSQNDEKPIRPEDATGLAMVRMLTEQTDEWRERRRIQLLATTPHDVRSAMMATLRAAKSHSGICVVAGRKNLEQANKKLKHRKLSISDIERND